MDIQGEGRFLLARYDGPGTYIIRSPKPSDYEDVVLRPGAAVAVDQAWLNVPHFVRDAEAGKFILLRSDSVPLSVRPAIAAEYEDSLTPTQKQLVYTLCEMPLDEQLTAIIHIGKLVTDAGIPRKGTRVTKQYLKESHLPFLMATADLEKRWFNRKAVLRELKDAIQRINSL